MTPPTRECALKLGRSPRRRDALGLKGAGGSASLPTGRVPRLARLLALAHKCNGLLRQGAIARYAVLARLGHISRARVSQIMALVNLAPDIQEEILFLPNTVRGRDRIHLQQLLPITQVLDWSQQRALWATRQATLHQAALGQDLTPECGLWRTAATTATTIETLASFFHTTSTPALRPGPNRRVALHADHKSHCGPVEA
jgi:hypothetical protein